MRKLLCGLVTVAVVVGLSPASHAAPPAAHQVFGDPLNDGDPLRPDFTPPYQDLVAGFISETETTVDFTWQVADLPDSPAFLPVLPALHWEFAFGTAETGFAPCTERPNRCFSLRASIDATGAGTGALESNCAGTPVVECEPVAGAVINVTYDGNANQITASVRRSDISNPQDGELLIETVLFRGIAAFTTLGAVVCSCVMDTADLNVNVNEFGAYTMGANR